MSKFKFINIIDLIFLAVAIFLIVFAWVQFFIRNVWLSLFISTILALAVMIAVRYIKNKKYIRTQNTLDKNSNITRFKLAVQTMPSTKLSTIIKKLIPKQYSPKISKGDISFVKNNKVNVFTFYYSAELTDTKLLELVKTKPADNLTVFCVGYSKDAKLVSTAFKNKKITFITIEQLYEIFDKNDIQIDTQNIDLSKAKITIKEILKNSISREKSKGYFISGLILLFTSILIPYKIYYVIISSILFTLSLLCRIRKPTKVDDSIFK